MANKLNMCQPVYSKIEKKETSLSVDRLLKITEILETNINDILGVKPKGMYNQNNYDSGTIFGHQDIQSLYKEN